MAHAREHEVAAAMAAEAAVHAAQQAAALGVPSQLVCGDFLKDGCARGAACRFVHVPRERPAVGRRTDGAEPLEIWSGCDGNTMSLEFALHSNIIGDMYFKTLLSKVTTVAEWVEEAKEEAKEMNAWGAPKLGSHLLGDRKAGDFLVIGRKKNDVASHQNEAPTRAWALLFRLFQLRPTEREVSALLEGNAKAMLRVLGVLYLRFTQPPASLFDWYRPLLRDEQTRVEIRPGVTGHSVTLASFVRSVLLEQCFLGTRFPRIPERVIREIRGTLGEGEAGRDGTGARREERRERDEEGRRQATAARRRAGGRLDLIDDRDDGTEPPAKRPRGGRVEPAPAARTPARAAGKPDEDTAPAARPRRPPRPPTSAQSALAKLAKLAA